MDIQQLVKVITTALRSFTVGLITRLDSQIQETEDECDTESEAERQGSNDGLCDTESRQMRRSNDAPTPNLRQRKKTKLDFISWIALYPPRYPKSWTECASACAG
jgi:hypothetical protein